MKRREFLSSAALAATPFIGGTEASANPAIAIFEFLFKEALKGAAAYLGERLMQELIAGWTGPHVSQLPPASPPGWKQPVWPPRPPVPPLANFPPPPLIISLWLSPRTSQIYEIRRVGPFFAVSSLNPMIQPDLVGGGILQRPVVHVQAFGPRTGPFSVGQLLERIEPNGEQRLQGATYLFQPVDLSWICTRTIDWIRLR